MSADHLLVYLGPLRDEAPLPVTQDGADWTPVGGWTDVSALVASGQVDWDTHEHVLTLTLWNAALDTSIWLDDRQIIARARWLDPAGNFTAWQVAFAGYLTGEKPTAAVSRDRFGLHRSGTVVARQEWYYTAKRRLPHLTFGAVDLAAGRPTTASSTLVNPAGEIGLEYLTTSNVGPDQAVDGNRDTLWIANTLADPVLAPVLSTGSQVIIGDVYNGAAGLPIGGNGRCRYIGLWAAQATVDTFEVNTAGWKAIRSTVITRTNAWAASGAWSMLLSATGPAAGAQRDYGGLAVEVECAVSFTLRSALGTPQVVNVIVSGDQGKGIDLVAPTDPLGRRYTIRWPSSHGGTLSIRFATTREATGGAWYVDDVRVSGGVNLAEQGQPYRRLWLVWDNGLGGSGYADIANNLDGILVIPGDRWVFLVDDADLFRSQFDVGDAQIIQYRGLSALTALDFGSQRGRLQLAYYRRWPDLPGTGGVVWDDLQFNVQPAFAVTSSLVRTVVTPATYVVRTNPAPGGEPNAGAAWLNVDLGSWTGPTLAVALGTTTPVIVTLNTTDKLPGYGYCYVETERVWLEKLSATDVRLTRTAPVAHVLGSPLYVEIDGVRATLPPVSIVGWQRRPGTPTIQDFDMIGSILPSPRDPSVPDQAGNTWGTHADWFNLATVRGWSAPSWAAVIDRDGDWSQTVWPPVVGYTAGWGRQMRHLRLVIHRMQPWLGQAQRAKVNSLFAIEADLAAGGSGGFAGLGQTDLRGVVGHLLTQYAGVPPAQVVINRGNADGIGWSSNASSLPIAASTVAEAIISLEARGRMQVFCSPGGLVRVNPDPMSTSAAFQAPTITWSTTNTVKLNAQQLAGHAVAQVVVTARNEVSGEVYVAAYPKAALPLGEIVQVDDVILGSQADAVIHAQRVFRQANARWRVNIETGGRWMTLPRPFSRNLVNITLLDSAGVELGNRSAMVDGFQWALERQSDGGHWRLNLSLKELQGWA